MNFKSTLIKGFSLALMLAITGSISAQDIFWSEDFSGGFPAGWTSEDISANYDTEWTWCEDSQTPPLTGCSQIWSDGNNNQSAFMSSTVSNGFLTLNSDIAALGDHGADPHISVLTSAPIDCSAQPEVWFKCESHIGAFELDPQDNAILRVSVDGGMNWTEYMLFPGLVTGATGPNSRWSENPQSSFLNLTDVAGGEAAVILQWQWTGGWEYHWNLDDIALATENLLPPNDMQVNSNFFAIAPNAQTPASQVETFGFLADVENVGSADQNGVSLAISIVDDADPGTSIYDETLNYGLVMADSIVENVLFDGAGFTPAGVPGTTYTGTYTISAEAADADLSNNVLTFNFAITDNVFAKDNGVTSVFGSAEENWDDDENYSWAYGNHYHVVNGDGWIANEVTFGIGNALDANVAGQTITIRLYEWDDMNNDGNLDPDERTPVGFRTYEIIGDEGVTEDDLITLPILDNTTLEQGVLLSDDTDYALVLEYLASDQTLISFLGSNEFDYGAQGLRSTALGVTRVGSLLGVNDPLDDEIYTQGGFGGGANVPIARLHIEQVVSVSNLSDDNKVNVFPSPARDYIDVALELAELQKEVTLSVVTLEGKTIGERQLSNVQENTYRFDLSTLPTGSYFLNVRTAEGNRNVPFVIAR